MITDRHSPFRSLINHLTVKWNVEFTIQTQNILSIYIYTTSYHKHTSFGPLDIEFKHIFLCSISGSVVRGLQDEEVTVRILQISAASCPGFVARSAAVSVEPLSIILH